MIITIRLVNTSVISHKTCVCMCVCACDENFQDILFEQLANIQYSLLNCSYHAVITSPKLIYLITGSLYSLPPPPASPKQPWQSGISLFLSLCVFACLFGFFLTIHIWDHIVAVFLCLTYFHSIMLSRFIHVVTNSKLSSLVWPSDIPLSVTKTFSLSISLSFDTWVVSMSWLLLMILQ